MFNIKGLLWIKVDFPHVLKELCVCLIRKAVSEPLIYSFMKTLFIYSVIIHCRHGCGSVAVGRYQLPQSHQSILRQDTEPQMAPSDTLSGVTGMNGINY